MHKKCSQIRGSLRWKVVTELATYFTSKKHFTEIKWVRNARWCHIRSLIQLEVTGWNASTQKRQNACKAVQFCIQLCKMKGKGKKIELIEALLWNRFPKHMCLTWTTTQLFLQKFANLLLQGHYYWQTLTYPLVWNHIYNFLTVTLKKQWLHFTSPTSAESESAGNIFVKMLIMNFLVYFWKKPS